MLSRCGGMADAADSKSAVGNYMWVQVPPPAFFSTEVCSKCFINNGYKYDT